ncbi:hypothetical protein AGIG_G6543 [Arapaima gigas]
MWVKGFDGLEELVGIHPRTKTKKRASTSSLSGGTEQESAPWLGASCRSWMRGGSGGNGCPVSRATTREEGDEVAAAMVGAGGAEWIEVKLNSTWPADIRTSLPEA